MRVASLGLLLAPLWSMTPASNSAAGEFQRSLATLRLVDDHPLYEMTFVGDYDALVNVAEPQPESSFGCSLFFVSGDPDGPLFARNFDWDPHAALVLHTDPPDGYASVSMVDIFHLGIGNGVDVLSDEAAQELLALAPLLPFDGANEEGLAIGLAADDLGVAEHDPARPTVGGVRIIRLALDNAATVDEAIDVFGSYNLDFQGGPALHYLLADSTGASAVIEFVDGEMVVLLGERPGQALTNFQQATASEPQWADDRRHSTAAAAIEATGGVMDWQAALAVLDDVHQAHTQWSVIYDLGLADAHVVTGQRWDTVHEFTLAG